MLLSNETANYFVTNNLLKCKSGAALEKKIRAEYLIPFCITNYNVEKLGKQFLSILTL